MMLALVLGLMTLIAVLVIVLPVVRHARSEPAGQRAAQNLAIYRDRLRELDADEAAGVLAPEEAEAARDELAAGLLQDTEGEAPSAPGGARGRHAALAGVIVIAAAVPLVAAVTYWQSDTWRINAAQPLPGDPIAVAALVERLEAYLAYEPQAAQGWFLLGRANSALGRYAEAAEAYAHANRISGNGSPVLLVAQGEALTLARNNDMRGLPRRLFERALEVDPRYPKALWYAGAAAFEAGDFGAAANHWQRLVALGTLPDDLARALSARIEEARARAGLPVADANAGGSDAAHAVSIPVEVTVSPELADAVPADATVYVFAKAADGSRMPLAVARRPASALPFTLTLDDSQAMMPSRPLSGADRWIVTARVSLGGSPLAQPGDLYARTRVDRAALPRTLHLEIDRRVGESPGGGRNSVR